MSTIYIFTYKQWYDKKIGNFFKADNSKVLMFLYTRSEYNWQKNTIKNRQSL